MTSADVHKAQTSWNQIYRCWIRSRIFSIFVPLQLSNPIILSAFSLLETDNEEWLCSSHLQLAPTDPVILPTRHTWVKSVEGIDNLHLSRWRPQDLWPPKSTRFVFQSSECLHQPGRCPLKVLWRHDVHKKGQAENNMSLSLLKIPKERTGERTEAWED